MEIPIANIYYLLCYAWEALEEKDTLADVGALDSTDLLGLFARVLTNGTRRLLRRGLDRGYLPCEGEIAGVRGKLLTTPTLRRDLLRCARAVCAWDELEYDTLPNRILKTTLQRLHEADELDPATGADVHDVARGIGLDGRIGRKFLHPGPGFGGSCFPKDTLALAYTAREANAPQTIVEQVIRVNDSRKKKMAQKVIDFCGGSVADLTIGVLGLTFKANTRAFG